MSLETAFKRLSIRPSKVCRVCRRSLATSAQRDQQQKSATTAMYDVLSSSPRNQSNPPPPRQRPAPAPSQSTPNMELAFNATRQATARSLTESNRTALADLRRAYTRKDLEDQLPRKWKVGNIYSPRDLSGAEASKWKKMNKKPRPKFDVLDQLGVNPLRHYTNFSMMGEYMSEVGRIRSGKETGLRPVNQRRMAKAIRRAVGVGLLMPGTYKHPEILKLERDVRRTRP